MAVYFRGERLATDFGHSIQQAEMNTAAKALREKAGERLFDCLYKLPCCVLYKSILRINVSGLRDGNGIVLVTSC